MKQLISVSSSSTSSPSYALTYQTVWLFFIQNKLILSL
jgi:hypothetical protein